MSKAETRHCDLDGPGLPVTTVGPSMTLVTRSAVGIIMIMIQSCCAANVDLEGQDMVHHNFNLNFTASTRLATPLQQKERKSQQYKLHVLVAIAGVTDFTNPVNPQRQVANINWLCDGQLKARCVRRRGSGQQILILAKLQRNTVFPSSKLLKQREKFVVQEKAVKDSQAGSALHQLVQGSRAQSSAIVRGKQARMAKSKQLKTMAQFLEALKLTELQQVCEWAEMEEGGYKAALTVHICEGTKNNDVDFQRGLASERQEERASENLNPGGALEGLQRNYWRQAHQECGEGQE
eukprot:3255859-Rhodomonas_salina.2